MDLLRLVLSSVLYLSLCELSTSCPSGWRSFEEHCYRYYVKNESYSAAELACQRDIPRGHLVSIHSQAENDFIKELIRTSLTLDASDVSIRIWTGLKRDLSSGDWRYSDGTELDYADSTDDELLEDCIVLSITGWYGNDCTTDKVPFVCKAPKPNIRLVEGPTKTEGRVEVFYNNSWGTICHDYWNLIDGDVVCRSLGLSRASMVSYRAKYGEGTGHIWLDNVQCNGNESSIFECNHRGVGIHNCRHSEDAGVRCSVVRLVDGTTEMEGRVEVFHDGSWGTVCDDDWDIFDVAVVCRSLRFWGTMGILSTASFGEGSGNIVFNGVQCVGNESSILDCPHGGSSVHNCHHSQDAGVRCVTVRLIDTATEMEGRVEVFYNGSWGTICDDDWDKADGDVVCRSLGSPGAIEVFSSAAFGEGPGTIMLNGVHCVGNESSIFDCAHGGPNVHNCQHSQDTGVRCLEVRLVDGPTKAEGRIEVFSQNSWGTICGYGWDLIDGDVVCRSLGFSHAIMVSSTAKYGEGTGDIWLDNVRCNGDESSIFECNHRGVGIIYYCRHSWDAGVRCFAVRLVDGTTEMEGRVEVFYDGSWGTVCDDEWDVVDGGVVCRSLRFSGAMEIFSSASFGEGSGNVVLDDVQCVGNESSILDCPHGGSDVNDCHHSQDAGVRCSGGNEIPTCT